MTLGELILRDFDVNLPISGGNGGSFEDAVGIENDCRDYVGAEYAVIKYIHLGMGKSWETVKSELLEQDGKVYDRLKIAREGDETHFYNYYFDITPHYKKLKDT